MKILCIGRNYVAHIEELNHEKPTEPVFFMKPDTALLRNNAPFYLPAFSSEVHYETELVLRIGKMGKAINRKFAYRYIEAVGLGFDFTARDLQNKLKDKGLPWEASKAFDNSAAISPVFVSYDELKDKDDIVFSMKKNGNVVQEGHSKNMIFKFDEIIAYLSQFVTLRTGDLIFTGTPKGVGKLEQGDLLDAYLGDKKMLETEIR